MIVKNKNQSVRQSHRSRCWQYTVIGVSQSDFTEYRFPIYNHWSQVRQWHGRLISAVLDKCRTQEIKAIRIRSSRRITDWKSTKRMQRTSNKTLLDGCQDDHLVFEEYMQKYNCSYSETEHVLIPRSVKDAWSKNIQCQCHKRVGPPPPPPLPPQITAIVA